MAIKIFEAINNIQGKGGRFGYSLTSTASVMNSLTSAQQQFKAEFGGSNSRIQGGTGGDFLSVGDYSGGDLVSNALSGYYDSEGYVNNGYLAQVTLHNYGAFVVTKNTDDGEMSAIVPVNIGNDQMKNGINCSGKKQFLSNVNEDFNSYEGLEKFVYGFAIDVANFGVQFFHKYYPSLNLDYTKLSKLMEEKCLCATIKFNNTEITGLVTVDYHQGTGAHMNVYVPNILLMKEQAKVGVYVSVDNATAVAVGSGDIQHPNTTYDIETGQVELGPEDVKKLIQGSNLSVSYVGCSLQTGMKETKASMRLFLNANKQDKAKEIIAINIPTEISDRLFNLVDNDIEYGRVIGIGSVAQGHKNDSAFYAEGQVDWVKFRRRHPNLPAGHEEIIENIARQFNINTRMWMTQMGLETGWFTSKNFRTRKNPGGISAGVGYKGGQTYTLDYLGGVRATRAVEVRGEGYGHYWIFETYEDGYRAMAYLLVNSKRYGLAKFGAQTVYEHFTNMYKGGYCDLRRTVCQSYNDKLMNQYIRIC